MSSNYAGGQYGGYGKCCNNRLDFVMLVVLFILLIIVGSHYNFTW